ncbi:MAG: 50S ribosomal protein L18 [Planctomycetota bacterium]
MKPQKALNIRRWLRTNRVRKGVRGDAGRPRLSVYRSNAHLYCQVVDDESGRTLASASTRDKDLRDQVTKGGNCTAAKLVGEVIAQRAQAAGITQVKFDRGRYKYHGRVAELAEAARAAGLSF